MLAGTKAIRGPVFVAAQQRLGLYVFGEDHRTDGDPMAKDATHVIDLLVSYAERHPITVLMEANAASLHMYKEVAREQPSPLTRMAKLLLETPGMIPDRMDILLIDVRHEEPFCRLESLYAFESYARMHVPKTDYAQSYRRAFREAKELERDVFRYALRNRKSCERFFLALIDPGLAYPEWFARRAGNKNPVKEMVAGMQKDLPVLAQSLRGILQDMVNRAVMDNPHFTPAMERAEATRHTRSQHFVSDKHALFQAYMTALHALVMDLYALGKLIVANHRGRGPVVFLGGTQHAHSVLRYLPKDGMRHVESRDGVLDLSRWEEGPPTLQVGISPRELLEEWVKK